MMTHATADSTPEESAAATAELEAARVTLALHSHEEFTRFFDGLEPALPGVEVVHRRHPELGDPVPGQDDGVIPGYEAVGRKGRLQRGCHTAIGRSYGDIGCGSWELPVR